jgi:heme/copper-type cytochrome/quinol oxidase subunit 2
MALLLYAPAAPACSACFGKSDSALAQGMNWGIFTLLGFIGLVLLGVAAFFVFLVRRAAAQTAVQSAPQPQL